MKATVFSTTGCPKCHAEVKRLELLGITVTERFIDQDLDAMADHAWYGGGDTVPFVVNEPEEKS